MSETTVTDGRAGRGARTRDAVVEALLALIHGGNLRPTAREVADEAGVSLRSVYVHFDDVESLFVAATTRHFQHMEALWRPAEASGGPEERVERFVAQRRLLCEEGALVRRAAQLQEPFSPVLRRALERGRCVLRNDVEAMFASELHALPERERPRLQSALEVVASGDTWDALRNHQGMSADDAERLVRQMMCAMLRTWEGSHTGTGDPPIEDPPPSWGVRSTI